MEALQSASVDSYGVFRWNFDEKDYLQLVDCVRKLPWMEYEKRILAGFSAGCDAVIRAVAKAGISCDGMLLQSPVSSAAFDAFAENCRDKGIWVKIFCGEKDAYGLKTAVPLYEKLMERGVKAQKIICPGLRHEFPKELGEEYR